METFLDSPSSSYRSPENLILYSRTSSPFTPSPHHQLSLSSIENRFKSRSPSSSSSSSRYVFDNIGEDVIVMDGILLKSFLSSASPTDSKSSSSSSAGNMNHHRYRIDICRFWEDTGTCRFGSKCQSAHGKEELRPSRYSTKKQPENRPEGQPSKTTGTSYAYVAKSQPLTAAMNVPASTQVGQQSVTNDWSPADDGIIDSSETGALEASISNSGQKKRLPIFRQICPE